MEEKKDFVITVYEGNGKIYPHGYSKNNLGMIVFVDAEGNSISSRGNSRDISKQIAFELSHYFKSPAILSSVRFNFYDGAGKSFPIYSDGFFPRPAICLGAYFVKALQFRRRDALAREIRRCSPIQDLRGRKIELLIENDR